MNLHNGRPSTLSLTAGLLISCLIGAVNADELASFSAPLNVEYERPGSDFSQFDRLLIEELDLSETIIVPPPWLAEKAFKWKVSEKTWRTSVRNSRPP